jgi:drug/metabolite transporter (DMT)-like permease
MFDAKVLGTLAALGSAASWAVGSVLFARLGASLNPVPLTFAKGIVGSVFLAAALIVSPPLPIPSEALLLLIVSGVLGVACGDALFFAALQRLGASTVVLLFALGQALTVVLAVIWLSDRPSPVQWSGIAIIVVSVSMILWLRREPDNGRTQLAGVLYGLGAILSMSVSLIVAKQALEETKALDATLIRMLAGVAGIGLWALFTGELRSGLAPVFREPGLALRLSKGVAVVTFGGFWLAIVAIKYINVSVANTLTSTEPIFVLPLAAFVLNEKITMRVIVCAIATVIGVALLSLQL